MLGPDDERWYAFGFDKPHNLNTSEVPENLTVTLGAPGSHTLITHWDEARRVESYRVLITNVAGGAE